MPILIVISGVILLLVLISLFKIDAFIALILVCLYVGFVMGLPLESIVNGIQKGIGDTLGFLVLILGFGAMLGKIVAKSGAADRITQSLISLLGLRNVHISVILTAFIVGIPMFYNVGFVIMVPIVFSVAASTGLPLLYVGVPMLSALSVTHGYLPPHPSPTAIAGMFHADMGKTMFYGIIVAIPTILVAGPLLAPFYRRFKATPLEEFVNKKENAPAKMPSVFLSVLVALMPVILIGSAGLSNLIFEKESLVNKIFQGIGNPVIAMLLSVFFAIVFLELRRGEKMQKIMESLVGSVSGITMILLVLAGTGALKEVLILSGISDYLGKALSETAISPLVMGWLIAAVIRVSIGSATVAGLTAAGIVLPLVTGPGVTPELMVLSIGAGSLMFSHVNDTGFWMFKEYFGLSVKDTFFTWTLMETVVSLVGLACVLLLDLAV